MLRPKPQMNLNNAREYFREHLCVGDYYAQGQTISGEWLGNAAEKLGLKGQVGERDFLALCEGTNPQTGEWLTQRRNTVRQENGRTTANRRIFHDFTISPPKSVSIVALYQDERIVDLHGRAVRYALAELEKYAETRVRKGKRHGERVTGNVVAACFQHETSRELDPHLHTHCVVFNATFDPAEGRWKALETAGMYRAQKFAENLYFHELSKGLRGLGYEIENNARNFEIKGVPAIVIARFSKRHEQIDAEAERQVAQGYNGNMGELRARIAHEHRRRKMKNANAETLRSYWREQMGRSERRALGCIGGGPVSLGQAADARALVKWADDHLFERRSVVNDHELMAAALARGRGQNFDLADLALAIEERGYVREKGSCKLANRELLRCELEIVRIAQDRRNCFYDFVGDYQADPGLSFEQAQAARRILTSRDLITIFRGGAGTGKTHTLKEIERAIRGAGTPVVVLAPQRQQVHGLENDGLPAQTLAHLLASKQLPTRAAVILDEAGQVGGRDLRQLIHLVESQQARLILSGDTRQHGAVAASDALRAIERYSHPRVAVLRTIRRQNPSLGRSREERRHIRQYRAAVERAASGYVTDSFDRLEKLGCIRQLPDEQRREAVAIEYLSALNRDEQPLVVAQTWSEVHAVNEAIRSVLAVTGKLRGGAILRTYQPADRTEAQRRDPRFYEAGQAVVFVKGYGRFGRGDLCEVIGANQRGVVLIKNDRRSTVSYRYAGRFAVARPVEIEVAPGDRLQLKANGQSIEGAPLRNGELVTVSRIDATGTMAVMDEHGAIKTLGPSQRLLVRGYAVTSYASQGKTADTVILADSGNPAATNAQQWYVSISRGRKRVVVYTPDKQELRLNIQRSGNRELATEIEPETMTRSIRMRNLMRLAAANSHYESLRQAESRTAGYRP